MINVEYYKSLIESLENKEILVAVSKTKPIEAIKQVYQLGQREFGENKVQELLLKKEALPEDIKWHLIGPLQENKVNKVVGNVYLIHSVSKLKLAEKINRRAESLGIVQNILLQMNISEEETKSGFLVNDAFYEVFGSILALKHIRVMGLMTMGPHVQNPDEIRRVFKQCKLLRDQLNRRYGCSLTELSMGMSGDYKIALEEGATRIRVGSAIFGER